MNQIWEMSRTVLSKTKRWQDLALNEPKPELTCNKMRNVELDAGWGAEGAEVDMDNITDDLWMKILNFAEHYNFGDEEHFSHIKPWLESDKESRTADDVKKEMIRWFRTVLTLFREHKDFIRQQIVELADKWGVLQYFYGYQKALWFMKKMDEVYDKLGLFASGTWKKGQRWPFVNPFQPYYRGKWYFELTKLERIAHYIFKVQCFQMELSTDERIPCPYDAIVAEFWPSSADQLFAKKQ